MKNDRIVKAFNTVQPNDDVKNRVFVRAMQKQHKKRPVFKAAVSFATVAAVICLITITSMFLTPQGDNIFVIKAYAMEVQENGSVQLREVDIADSRPKYWGGHIDGETRTMYVGLGLRCVGGNIESVEFSTGNSFFAKQYIGNLSDISTKGVPALFVGPDNRMVMFGEDFDNVGSTITLDKETVDDYLLFWGTNYVGSSKSSHVPPIPKEINLHAKVTFSNGKTEERDITIDLSGAGTFGNNPSEEQKAQDKKDYEAYENLLQSIPLDKCEVVPDSVQVLKYRDRYAYHMGNPFATHYASITEESMAAATFDESGVFRIGSIFPNDGSDGYIAVIMRDGEDTFTGMVYKVPGRLILEHMK